MLRRFDPARLRSTLGAAALVGVGAGLTSALLLSVTGEPLVRQAIAIEGARSAAPAGAEPELVSRAAQSGFGLFAALGLTGAVFGVLLALTSWGLRRAQPDPFRRSLWAGVLLFGSITLLPWLKYPPNPPAVGDPGTLARRQALYVSLIALSLALGLVGVALAGRLRRAGWPEARRVAVLAVAGALAVGTALAALPAAPDPVTVPATLIWRFRLSSLGGNALLWAILSVGFGVLAAEGPRRTASAEVVTAPGASA